MLIALTVLPGVVPADDRAAAVAWGCGHECVRCAVSHRVAVDLLKFGNKLGPFGALSNNILASLVDGDCHWVGDDKADKVEPEAADVGRAAADLQ